MTDKGYLVPDPIDPGDLMCFRVYVPAHTWYIGAFWSAYEFFTTWLAWARDPLHKGRQAAAVWRVAFDKARAEFERTKGVCTMAIIGIRNKPLVPCIIQYETDDGIWHDGPDMSCCGGGGGGGCGDPLRVGSDGAIQRYDASTNTWPSTTPGLTGADNTDTPPAYTNNPQGRCLAGANYSAFVMQFLENLLIAASQATDYGTWAAGAAVGLLTMFGNPLPIIQEFFAIAIATLTEQQPIIAARLAAKDNVDMLCLFVNRYSADGKMTAENVAKLRADLYAKADATADENQKWWYVHAGDLVAIWRTQGADNGANSKGITTADCSNCPTTVSLDFAVSKWGFAMVEPAAHGKFGSYVAGQGWRTFDDPATDTGVNAEIHIQQIHVLSADLTVQYHLGTNYALGVAWFTVPQSLVPSGGVVPADGTEVIHYGDMATRTALIVAAATGFQGNRTDEDWMAIKKLEITFTGPVPDVWAAAVV